MSKNNHCSIISALYKTEPLDYLDELSQRKRILCKLAHEHPLFLESSLDPPTSTALVKASSELDKRPLDEQHGHPNEIPFNLRDTNTIVSKLVNNLDPLKESLKLESDTTTQKLNNSNNSILIRKKHKSEIEPERHPNWKLMRVISGHLGWVRSLAVEPGNQWFASGSGDRTIKIWDLASGTLKLSLTGHVSCVRGLAVSDRHPYLYSAGEDKMIKCWDLECNKVIRHYHGHLSGIYCMDLHPRLDILMTGGRDATCRVWDMRTKACVRMLHGHKSTIATLKTMEFEPQVITGSMDSTVRLFDLTAGKTRATLTHHKKGVRAISLHHKEFSFLSGAADHIKQFNLPDGTFVKNFEHDAIVNTLCINQDNVVVSGADNGSINFHDWKSGKTFQNIQSIPQPGSLDSEAGIFCSTFDKTGLRLITGEADKSIKIYKEIE